MKDTKFTMWGKKKKGTKKLTKEENKNLAFKSKDKGNNESVSDLRDIKNSKWL